VATIIAVLLAIAIPQFNSYRVRGYNAAAVSDIRNARSAEEAFYSNHGVYPSSKADGSSGVGLPLANGSASVPIVQYGISDKAPAEAATFTTGLSQNVRIVINTSDDGGSYVMASKSASGDRCIGADSDVTNLYWTNGRQGLPLDSASLPIAVLKNNDLSGIAGTGVCSGSADGGGQKNWDVL